MEGAALVILEFIAAEGAICIVATLRFLFLARQHATRRMADVGLLLLQLAFFALCGPAMGVSLYRNSGDLALLMRDAAVLLPLAAACIAQVAMFVRMREGVTPSRSTD